MERFILGKLMYSWVVVILWRIAGKQIDKINEQRKAKNPECKVFSIDYKSTIFKVVGMIVLQSVYLGSFIRDFMNNRYSDMAAAVTFIVFVTVVPISLINALVLGMRRKQLLIATGISSLLTIGWYITASIIWI